MPMTVNAKEIFLAASELPAGPERDDFLKDACGGDAQLRRRVELLLSAHESAGSLLDQPAVAARTEAYLPIAEGPNSVIGPYRLMEQIGEGGFGLVFVAEQQEPVKRKVALKIIKPGMDSKQVIARFEAERQALALMEHPNIARVLDAGATASGRPYFVMELVRGIPITDYCDQNQLAPRERLELFITVCQAIQHAHQKGIIHRDIKPSNVLVTSHDGRPMAKVIDFGIAKAMSQQLTHHTLYTNFAQMIGTPLYMSPEQAEMSGLDIDTRSDIYSLGVLLYELLTGTTPLEKKRFAKAAYDEIRRLIREEEPPKPSTRISQATASLPSVAAQRKMEPTKLSKLVRGDLDWITMKALEKDRTRRYETANGLARDIQRYLADELVEARPPSTGYRLRKFAKKHRTMLTTLAAMLLLLVAGAAISTWQAVRAKSAESAARASEQEAHERKTEADDAKLQAEKRRDELALLNQNLRRANYLADMNLARVAWEENNLGRCRELLDKYRAPSGGGDMRGFEWHYLSRLFHGDLLTVKAHGGWVTALAFMPDGRTLLTSGTRQPPLGMKYFDKVAGDVRQWDAATGQPLRFQLDGQTDERLTVLGDRVRRLALSRDGSQLAVSCWDADIRVWDFSSRKLMTLQGPAKNTVLVVGFSTDGKRFVSMHRPDHETDFFSAAPPTFRIWDLATRKAVVTIDGLPSNVGGPCLSPDGKYLAAVARGQGRILVFDTVTGKEAFDCKFEGGYLPVLIFSPDSQRLYGCIEEQVKVWSVATHEQMATWQSMSALGSSLAVSPDGKRLAMGGIEGVVELWDTATGRKVDTFKGHSGSVEALEFSPDGKRLATGGADGTLRMWDTTERHGGLGMKPDLSVDEPKLSPDGQTLLTGLTWEDRKKLRLWNTATGEQRGEPVEFPQYTEVSYAWSANSKHIYLADAGKTVRVVEAATSKVVRSFSVDAEANYYPIAISADEKWCAYPGPGHLIKIRSAQTGAESLSFEGLKDVVRVLTFSPDGARLVGADESGKVAIWDVTTGRMLANRQLDGIYFEAIQFSQDGKQLAVVGNLSQFLTGEARILSADDLREVWSLKGHTLNVNDVAFSPDGQRLATASGDNTVRLWDLITGQEILKLSHPRACALQFVSSGQRLMSVSMDRSIRIWDATPHRD